MNKYYHDYQSTTNECDKVFDQVFSYFNCKPLNILEVACNTRNSNNTSSRDGYSMLFCCDYIKKNGGKLTIVALDKVNLDHYQAVVSDFINDININFICGDGLPYVNQERYDFIYLGGSDSFLETVKQFDKIDTNITSVLVDDFPVKGILIRTKYKNFQLLKINERHEMAFYPSQALLSQSQSYNAPAATIKSFTNEINETQNVILIEKNGEKILPVIFYGENYPNWKNVLNYNKKVFNTLGVHMNYLKCPFPNVSHGQMIDEFIQKTIPIADYWIFMENDSIPLNKNIIDVFYDKVKDKLTVAGTLHQSNHKTGPNGEMNHPYVGPSFHMISKELYLKLGSPSYNDVGLKHSDTAEEVTYQAEKLGYIVCGVWPKSVDGLSDNECAKHQIDPKHKTSNLGNGSKFGFGTQYGDLVYHQMCQNIERSSVSFINKCKEILGETTTKLEPWIDEVGVFFPSKLEAFKEDIQNNTQHVEQYKRLKEWSDKFNGELILDIGTDVGVSALILGMNGKNKVISFDIEPMNMSGKAEISKKYTNIEYRIHNLLQNQDLELLRRAKLIYLDVNPHNGIKEIEFMKLIKKSGFRGILIADDIHLNDGMEEFWNGIDLPKRDITHKGHHTGTGEVFFYLDLYVGNSYSLCQLW